MQLVIAAITTLPWRSAVAKSFELRSARTAERVGAFAPGFSKEGNASANEAAARDNSTRSCGRLGPAIEGSIWFRSMRNTSVYSASGELAVWNSPCSL